MLFALISVRFKVPLKAVNSTIAGTEGLLAEKADRARRLREEVDNSSFDVDDMLRAQHDVDAADAEVATLQKSVDYWKEVRTALGGDIKPIGKGTFGNIYDQFKGKAKEAIQFLLGKKEGEAIGALHHKDIGDISIVWGNAKAGLQKILNKHPEVINDLQGIIDGMNIVEESDNRIKLESDTHFAVVSKEYKGTPREKWLLTAYEKKETSKPANSSMDVDSNQIGKSDDTATRQNTDVSLSKDNVGLSDMQEKVKETVEQDNKVSDNTLSQKIASAESEVNTTPSEGQKKAGNYKNGHVQIGSFNVTIEQPKGSVRSGVDKDGKKWSTTMQNTYGYIRGTEGVDGDHIDVFLSDDIDGWDGRKVFVVDQYNPDGTFDEHKVMLGFNDIDAADAAYLSNYEKGWSDSRKIVIRPSTLEDFEKWINSSHRKTKPFSEYSSVEENRRKPLRERVSEWANKLGIDMVVLENLDEVTNSQAREAIESGDGRYPGWYGEKSGKVYIYLPHVTDVKDIDETVVHEVVAHKGLRRLMGEKFDALCDMVWNSMSKENREKFMSYPGVNGNHRAAADEYMAYIAEKTELTEEERGIWDKIVQFVKDLITLNLGVKLSDDQIAGLIRASYAEMKREAGKQKEAEATDTTTHDTKNTGRERHDELIMIATEARKAMGERQAAYSPQLPKQRDLVAAYEKNDSKEITTWKKQFEDVLSKMVSLDIPMVESTIDSVLYIRDAQKHNKDSALYKAYNDIAKMLRKQKSKLESQLTDSDRDVLNAIAYSRGKGTRFRFAKSPQDFDTTQKEAVEKKGIVMSGLNEAVVNVVDVPRHNFTGTGKDAIEKAEKWANDNIAKEHTYHKGREDEFKYVIDEKAIGKFLSKSSTGNSDNLGVHLAVLKKLPEVIDNSIDVEIHPDYIKNDKVRSAENGVGRKDLLVHRMYGAVSIDDKIYLTKTTIHEFKDKENKAYDYKITEVKLIISGSSTSNALNSSTSVDAAKLLKDVEKSYDNGKKVLTESETRFRSVYHGSGAEFDMFDHSHMGEGEGNQLFGWGTYVTDVEGIGKQYGRATSKPRLLFKGSIVDSEGFYNPWHIIMDLYNAYYGLLLDMRHAAKFYLRIVEDDNVKLKELWENVIHTLDNVRSEDLKIVPGRYLYTVEIPDDNGSNYLHWDGIVSDEVIDRLYTELESKLGEDISFQANLKHGQDGEHLYKKLGRALGSDKQASEFLNEQGFVGISYPAEAMSGGRADGARNFVIFNEADAKIDDRVMFRKVGDNMEHTVMFRSSPLFKGLRELEDGETCDVERIFTENKYFEFSGVNKIKSYSDVAYIFKQLEDESIENAFAVLVKRGKPTVIHLGMGHYTQSMVNKSVLNVAVTRMNPDKIYFVHNHPSGQLKASAQDVCMLQSLQEAYGSKMADGIIINTRSGQYGVFNEDSYTTKVDAQTGLSDTSEAKPLKVYTFSKQVFSKDYQPGRSLLSSEDVARFVSSHRLGDRKKLGLIISNNNGITGNIFLPYTDINKDNAQSIASDIIYYTSVMGGTHAVMFGNTPVRDMAHEGIGMLVEEFSGLRLLDYLKIDGGRYYSASDEGLRFRRVTPAEDKAYMDAVERGDMDTAMQMVKEAAKRAMPDTKVVDEDGYPMVVYHGSPANDITVFDNSKASVRHSGSSLSKYSNRTHFFIDSKDAADASYAKGVNGKVYPVFLNIKKPKIVDYKGARWDGTGYVLEKYSRITNGWRNVSPKAEGIEYFTNGDHINNDGYYDYRNADEYRYELKKVTDATDVTVEKAIESGEYDGVVINNVVDSFNNYDATVIANDYVTFQSPSQIKSAEPVIYDDNGNVIPLSEIFNEENEDIRFRVANRNQVGFVSNAMKAVEGIKQEKATPQQWLAMIEKQGGLKAGEDKWLGLSDWLKSSDKKTLTKDEVLEFIGENMIRIEEVKYGERSEVLYFDDYEVYNEWQELGGDKKAFNELAEKYGDDFTIAFSYDETFGIVNVDDAEAAMLFGGYDKGTIGNPINSTRLDYTTEGLDNKREIALTVPTIDSWNEYDDIHFGDAGDGRAVAWIRFGEATTYENVDDVQQVTDFHEPYKDVNGLDIYKPIGSFRNGDFIAHGKGRNGDMIYVVYINGNQVPVSYKTLDDARVGMNEYYKEHPRKLRKPLKVLVIDEIQSKRHQEGREKGYKNDSESKLVPSAPFEKNWHELAMKRMLRLAAEEGFDKVAWTTGAQQAERYNIGTMVRDIEVLPVTDAETGEVLDAEFDVYTHSNSGNYISEATGRMNTEQIMEVFGKDLGGKIIEGGRTQSHTVISGKGLNIGGEGMKGFYDRMLPSFVNKYTKKWGTKVGEVELPELEESAQKMWSVDVTEQMKAEVEEQVMFRKVSEQIEDMFDSAISGDLKGKPISIGKLTVEGKEYLELISGLTLKNDVDFVLNPSDLVHIYNDHYGTNEKDKGNNIPLTKHDIKRMVDVVAFPSKIIYGTEPTSGRNLFYFLMDSLNGTYNLLEVYANKKGNLTAKTYYKTKKDATQRVMELSKTLLPTSETYSGAILSKAKVPQMFESANIAEEKVLFRVDEDVPELMPGESVSDFLVRLKSWRRKNSEYEFTKNQSPLRSLYEVIDEYESMLKSKDKEIRSLDERLRHYANRLSKTEKRNMALIKDRNTINDLRSEIERFIRKQISSDFVSYMRKSDLNNLLHQMHSTNNMDELENILLNVNTIVRRAEIRHTWNTLDRLLSLKVQGVNGRNMSIARNVDDSTRRIFSYIRGTVADLRLSGYEEEMTELRKKGKVLTEDLKGAENELSDATDEATKNDIMTRIDQIKKEQDERKNRMKELETLSEEAKKSKGDDTVNNIESELSAMQAIYEEKTEKGTWTTEDNERLTALNLMQLISHNSRMSSAMTELEKGIDLDYNSIIHENNPDKLESAWATLKGKKMEYANALNQQLIELSHTVKELRGLIEGGRKSLLARREAEAERRRNILLNGIQSVRGKHVNIMSNELRGRKGFLGVVDRVRNFITLPLASFEYMTQRISTTTGSSEDSWLYKYFVKGKDGVLAAYDTYKKGIRQAKEAMDAEAENIFGKNKRFSDLMIESDKVIEKSGVYKLNNNDDPSRGYDEMIEVPLSKGQAMYIYMVWKMDDGRSKLTVQGFNENSIAAIRRFIGEKYVAYADWIQGTFLKDLRKKYNDKYLEIYDTSLAEIKNYVPLRIRKESVRQESDLSDDKQSHKTLEQRAGSLINRVVNVNPVDINMNGFAVIADHVNQMEELQKGLRWVKKEKVQDWLGIADLNRPIHTSNPELISIANVIKSFENPNK